MQKESTFRPGITQIFRAPDRKKLIHFECQFEALKSGILRIQKMCQILEGLRILELFSDHQNSTSKCSKLPGKVS